MGVIRKPLLFVSTGTDSVRKAESTFSPIRETGGYLMGPIQNFSEDKVNLPSP